MAAPDTVSTLDRRIGVTPWERLRPWGAVSWSVRIGAFLVVLASLLAAADEPLRVADIVRYLEAGISERIVLAEVRDRGMAEPVDAVKEEALRRAGASDTVLEAVRRAAPPPPPAAEPIREPSTAFPSPPASSSGRNLPRFGVSTRSVRVPVSVVDKGGNPITNLSAADFRVTEEGKPEEITFFSGERKPLRLAIALDVSGSMADKVDEVVDALKHFIDLLEPADEVLVLTFNDEVRVVQDFTSDRRRVRRILDSLSPQGGTALRDAVIEAIQRVADAPAESKAVVLITDGVDTASRASFKDAREAARRAEVPVYSIGIGHESEGLRILGGLVLGLPGGRGGHGGHGGGAGGGGADFDARPLLDLAEETGAQAQILRDAEHHHTGKVDKIKEAAEAIALALRYRYLLAYEPDAVGKGGWRRIQVKVDRPSADVRARKGYYPE